MDADRERREIRLPRCKCAVAAALVAGVFAVHASADVFDWAIAANGNWSQESNWLGGSAPTVGGASTVELRFGEASPAPTVFVHTATNDLSGVFLLNRLLLADSTKASITVRNGSGAGLSFGGVNPRIDVIGLGSHTLSTASGGLGTAIPGNTAVSMVSLGSVLLSGPLTGAGGLTISGTEVASNLGVVQVQASSIANNNTFGGGVTLNSGNLYIDGATATTTPLGAGMLTINGGTVGFNSATTRISGPITANTDLRISRGTGTINGAIAVTNPAAGLQVYGGTLTLNVPAAFVGSTILGGRDTYAASTGPATLTLGSNGTTTDGTLLNTASIGLLAGAALNISNTSNDLANRLNDAAPVTMDSGTVSLRAASGGSAETIGATSVRGYSVLECQPGASTPFGVAALTVSSLSRADRGVLFVRGQNLGVPVGSPTSSTRYTTVSVGGGAPAMIGGGGVAGTTTISIVPWATASYSTTSSTSTTANTLATYGAGGFRPLNPATEFATTLGFDPTQNVNLTASVTSNDDPEVIVNSLVLTSGTAASIAGTGNIAVASGAVLASVSGSGSTIANSMSFGSTEGVITNSGPLAVSGAMTGSAGLTKSGNWPLVLSGDNTGLTGPLTINGGSYLGVYGEQNLPGSGPISVHSIAVSAGAGIGVSDAFIPANNPITISRPIVLQSGLCVLTGFTSSVTGVFTGTISGDGSLNINSAGSWGTMELTASNTYTGITRVNSGRVRIHSDENLGNGGMLTLSTAAGDFGVELADNWTTSRLVQVLGSTGFHTKEYHAVLNGPLAGSAEIWKDGSGSLTINADSPCTSDFYVREGELRVNAQFPATIKASLETTNPLFVNAIVGGTGRMGDLTLLGTLDPGSAAAPLGTLSMSSLTLSGNSIVLFDLGPGGDLVAADNAFAQAIVANPPPNNTTYHSVFASCLFSFTQLPGLQIGDTYELVHFGTNGAINVTTHAIAPLTVFSESHFTYTGLAPGLAGTFELTANALKFHVVSAVSGVCCRGATCNAGVAQAACIGAGAAGAAFSTVSGACNAGGSATSPCCYADYNKVNGVSVQDIFDFLSDWFGGSPFASVGGDGVSGPLAVQDIFDFLSAWFAGGCV